MHNHKRRKLKHLYINRLRAKEWFSNQFATIFDNYSQAYEAMRDMRIRVPECFIQAEYDPHFRYVDSTGRKVDATETAKIFREKMNKGEFR